MVELTTAPLDPGAVAARVEEPTRGGIVTFVGRVRNHHQGRETAFLEYEAYEPMATAQIAVILSEVAVRWPACRCAVAHRLGRLEIGDAAVVIAVAAAHRAEAFEACRYVIDRIKVDVPIWKRETRADGSSEWVTPGQESDHE